MQKALSLWLSVILVGLAAAAALLGFSRADSAQDRVWTTATAQLQRMDWQAVDAYAATALTQRVPKWRRQGEVGPLFMDGVPSEGDDGIDILARKRRFLAAMVPATLLVNRLLQAERDRLVLIAAQTARAKPLSARQQDWLATIAARYGANPDDLDTLLRRVDQVPPSLVLAQAAIESGWGLSRFARAGNALFGQYAWDGEGMVPKQRKAGARHTIKTFDSPAGAIFGYMHNLNTHRAYRQFRQQRAAARAQDEALDSLALAGTLSAYSTLREAYVRRVRTVIKQNQLTDFDDAQLSPAAVAKLPS
ncbi:MAG: hypothetical protein Tsb0016_03530 [Sphingomonadales bacterium]